LSSNTTLDYPAALSGAGRLAVRPGCAIKARGYSAPQVPPLILDCQASRDWLGSEPALEGLTDRLVTTVGTARRATSELVGQEGDIPTRSRLGGVAENRTASSSSPARGNSDDGQRAEDQLPGSICCASPRPQPVSLCERAEHLT
jgi:hypothetical protein